MSLPSSPRFKNVIEFNIFNKKSLLNSIKTHLLLSATVSFRKEWGFCCSYHFIFMVGLISMKRKKKIERHILLFFCTVSSSAEKQCNFPIEEIKNIEFNMRARARLLNSIYPTYPKVPSCKRHHMVSSTLAPLYTVFGLNLGCSRAAAPIGDKVL